MAGPVIVTDDGGPPLTPSLRTADRIRIGDENDEMPNLKVKSPHTVNNATAIAKVVVTQDGEEDQEFGPSNLVIVQERGAAHHIHVQSSGRTVQIIPSHAMNERNGTPGSGFQHGYEMPEDCVIDTINIDGRLVQFKPRIGVRVEVSFSA